MSGPLSGTRVLEMAGIGAVPHACMMLADMGAEVVIVDRARASSEPDGAVDPNRVVRRNRSSVRCDLKDQGDLEKILTLAQAADVIIEGFRPGVMERAGLGPSVLCGLNPGLVFVRVTGWGQDGPQSQRAGHDLNYLAATGLLGTLGRAASPPPPPLTLVANHGGGSMMAVTGTLAALLERGRSGRGQVVDVSMAEGAATLGTMVWSWLGAGRWQDQQASNLIDGAAPFYDTYRCADGRYVALAALEPQFYGEALRLLNLDEKILRPQYDPTGWPALRTLLSATFGRRPAAHWDVVFAGSDGCLTVVESLASAPDQEQLAARAAFCDVDGTIQPSPSPRFERTPASAVQPHREVRLDDVLESWTRPPA